MFEVIPAIDLRGGKVVQLVQGVPGTEMVSIDDYRSIAEDFISQGARWLHVVDLDGALSGDRRNAGIVEDIVKRYGVKVEVGGGIRDYSSARRLLEMGVARVILGTAALRDPGLVAEIAANYDDAAVMVSLDSKMGEVVVEGWTASSGLKALELGKRFEDLGAGSILFTNVDVEGRLQGVAAGPVRELVEGVSIPVVASGGIATPGDVAIIKKTGAAGVVVGSALYMGRLTLREAIDAAKI